MAVEMAPFEPRVCKEAQNQLRTFSLDLDECYTCRNESETLWNISP